jgi:hypothetical protein
MKRSSLGLVAAAVLMGGGIYIYDSVIAPRQEQAKRDRQMLFTFQPDEIQSLKITGPTPVLLQRRANPKDGEPKWELREPEVINASDGAVAFLTGLFNRSNPEAPTETPRDRRAEFGLDRPLGTVEITLKTKRQHRLILGKPTFDNSAIYAEVDPGSGKTFQLHQVAPEFSPAIGRPLAEWKYTAELPPSASPSASPSGSPSASPSASPSVSPSVNPAATEPSPAASPSDPATVDPAPASPSGSASPTPTPG